MNRRREMNVTAALLALMVLAGCGSSEPTGPGPAPMEGVTVFARIHYEGPRRTFLHDVTDFKLVYDDPQPDEDECADKIFGQEAWTDCISSIRVAPGWQVIVFVDDTFRGDSLIVTSDIPDLEQIPRPAPEHRPELSLTWDETISSMRVMRR